MTRPPATMATAPGSRMSTEPFPPQSTRLGPARRVAFFDVDETLISAKSMIDFWSWWAAREPGALPPLTTLLARARLGGSRAELNQDYYRAFAGLPEARLAAAGRGWYEDYRSHPDAFVVATVSALYEHSAARHAVVLVSGSHRACLEPLAEDLGADDILCTEQLTDASGRLTGETVRPMIGEAKAEAVHTFLTKAGLSTRDCFAYGDHSSDLSLLRSVGRATVIGEDPVLLDHARREDWERLSARTGPLPRRPRGGRHTA
ncbi:HAD-IB family hydrolase [Streptomyces sp. NPDC047079]|uniref:HAD family hydrolase n=1 Tax=Streptomyces sp. NPDC047079 TaxID=3154607 RepID=UPI0033ECCC35